MHETLLLIAQAVKSGVPLATAIRLTVGDQPKRGQAAFLRFAELLDKGLEPKVAADQAGLPKSIVELLDVALASGDFADTFNELAKLEVRRSLTIHRVVQSLAYPVILLVATILCVINILVFTVPGFDAMFQEFGSELPVTTEVIILLSRLVCSPLVLLGLGVLAATLYCAVRFLFPRFWLCVPVFGHIGRCLYTAKILRHLANQVSRNVPLPEALEQCGKAIRNPAYRRDCHSAAAAARKGMPFAEIAMRYYWLFPAWLAPMVAIDNVQESLPKSLRRAAQTVDQQQDVSLLFIQTMSLPLFIIVISIVLGWFVTAMFSPMILVVTCLA